MNWWQFQGFANYHGTAWYRKVFNSRISQKHPIGVFYFGSVDGNAVVYLNGKSIGRHQLGAGGAGWNQPFFVIAGLMPPGPNILAVKVTSKNQTTASGMTGGVTLLEAN